MVEGMSAGDFAAVAITLYAAHHVGDYWVQTDEQARLKGRPGRTGHIHCATHVCTYLAAQVFILGLALPVVRVGPLGLTLGLLVSGVTHYVADRKDPLKWIARHLPGKAPFLELGMPRDGRVNVRHYGLEGNIPVDNPQLATGLWALDQSWHIFWGVFVTALIMVGLS